MAIALVAAPAALALNEGEPVIPTLMVAAAAIGIWYVVVNRR